MGLFGKKPPLREITEDTEEEFADLSFSITDTPVVEGGFRFAVAGLHDGVRVGLAVEVRPLPKPGQKLEGTDIVVHPARVALVAVGEESHTFVRALAKLFHEAVPGTIRMTPRLELTGLSLEGEPARIKKEAVKIKLFYEPAEPPADEDEEPAEYFEWYLNVDARRGVLELREKDEEYRAAIIGKLGIGPS
jgi:hypothetical protein